MKNHLSNYIYNFHFKFNPLTFLINFDQFIKFMFINFKLMTFQVIVPA